MVDSKLQMSAEVLVKDLLKVKEGEVFVITADTLTDPDVIEAIDRTAQCAGAKVLLALTPSPDGVSLAADKDLAVDVMSEMLAHADVWVELNVRWLLYSSPYYYAKKNNPRLRHMCLTGTNADTLIRCVGQVNYPKMREF